MARCGYVMVALATWMLLMLLPHTYTDDTYRNLNFKYNFVECPPKMYHQRRVEGAEVKSQHDEFYVSHRSNCSLIITTVRTRIFLVQLTHLDLAVGETGCHDYLTIIDLDVEDSTRELLSPACSSGSQHWYTQGQRLLVNFIRSGNITANHSGFLISATALTRPPVGCNASGGFLCGANNDCISQSLICDGVRHCLRAEDEDPKHCKTIPPILAPTTTTATTTTIPDMDNDEGNFYLWLPLIVVVVFTIVMLMLIMAGRRATTNCGNGYRAACPMAFSVTTPQILLTRNTSVIPGTTPTVNQDENVDTITIILVAVVFVVVLITCLVLGFREQKNRQEQEQLNRNQLEINTNPGFTDGAPATPPPTYSMIERQTSYVSQISQSSSQLSIPPDYDEVVSAVNEDVPNGGGRRRRPQSRSSSESSRRPRFFQRSNSAQAAIGTRARFLSEGSGIQPSQHQRQRHFSEFDGSAESGRQRNSTPSESDNVFIDPPSRSSLTASNTGATSGLEGVLEADESTAGSNYNIALATTGRASTDSTTSTSRLLANPISRHAATEPRLTGNSISSDVTPPSESINNVVFYVSPDES